MDAGIIILNRFYKEKVDLVFSEIMQVRNKQTGLEKHLKFNILLDFVDVKAIKPLKKLTKKQIAQLLNNWEDESLWTKLLPPENFSFEGFVMGQVIDVTDREILSTVETMMAQEEGDIDYDEGGKLSAKPCPFVSAKTGDSFWQYVCAGLPLAGKYDMGYFTAFR